MCIQANTIIIASVVGSVGCTAMLSFCLIATIICTKHHRGKQTAQSTRRNGGISTQPNSEVHRLQEFPTLELQHSDTHVELTDSTVHIVNV